MLDEHVVKMKRLYSFILIIVCTCLLNACSKPTVTISNELLIQTTHVTVQSIDVDQVLNGRVKAILRADIRPQIDGIILKRNFIEGSFVSKGQTLYKIDDVRFKAAFDLAKATVDKTKAQLENARSVYERSKRLYKSKSISTQELEVSQMNYAVAKADLEIARASLEQAKIDLNYTNVLSPIDGIIGSSSVTPGSLVTANQEEILTVVTTLDKVYVDLQQSATDWRKFKLELLKGQAKAKNEKDVYLYFDDGTKYPIVGTLSLNNVIVNESSGAVTIRAVFDNPDQVLLPGMAVSARLVMGSKDDVMIIPANAVVNDAKGNCSVFVIKDNIAHKVKVKVGALTLAGYEILSGLSVDDVIAISGLSKLKDNMQVKVVTKK